MKKILLLAFFYTTFSIAENQQSWIPVTDIQLEIQQESALDFSSLVEAGPAGKHGSVVSGSEGHLVFSALPDKPQRFMCASSPYGVEEGFPDHETADKYAKQLKMHGYNLARFHFIENVLMDGKNKDFDFDPEQLDRLYYFMSALKREGIYWMMDALTSWNGAYGDIGPDRWKESRNVKLGVYYDNNDKEHWKTLVDKIFTKKNPYTDLVLLNDPALMGIILVNEGGLNSLINKKASAAMSKVFQGWLKQRYGSIDAAVQHWGGAEPELPREEWVINARMKDAQLFYFELQNSSLQWMTQYLRNLGYLGLVTAYNDWFHLQDIATRSNLEWVDLHTYHDHPDGFAEKGANIKQTSSLPDKVKYIREMMVSRYWGKPLTVSEYDQPFWNQWRVESGLAMGAYASFQDWDLICRHGSGPIELAYGAKKGHRAKAIYPFGMGLDPIARASDALATLLFLRKDVQSAKHRVAIRLNTDYALEKQGGIGKLTDDISKIGLVTGLGVIWNETENTKTDLRFSWVLNPENPAPTLTNKIVDKLKRWAGAPEKAWGKNLQILQQQGVLSQDNTSDGDRFESDTKEIVLDINQPYLQVNTEKTQAVAFAELLPPDLPNLKVISASEPALISLSSLDDKPINDSERLLLILATDARNTAMKFQDDSGKVLQQLGHLPVVIKAGRYSLQINNTNFDKLKLYALGLNGARKTEMKLVKGNKSVKVDIDLAKLTGGITTFFELVEN